MLTRLSTWRAAYGIWQDANAHDGKAEEKADAPTRFIWAAAGLVGAGVFVASFGALLLPFMGWGIIESGVVFVGLQYTASAFLDLHETWTKAAAWLHLWWNAVRGKNLNDQFVEMRPKFAPLSTKLAATP